MRGMLVERGSCNDDKCLVSNSIIQVGWNSFTPNRNKANNRNQTNGVQAVQYLHVDAVGVYVVYCFLE